MSFFATDHASALLSTGLGSTAATIWANGSVRAQLRYDPWGKERYAQHTTPTGYRYTSQRWDSGLGLYDYNARYYDPHIGRFISADTLVPDPAAPQAFNRYAYVLGNPLRHTDPTGHLTEDEIYHYFGFSSRLDAEHSGWSRDLINWLWDDAITWGDVFTYDAGEAMLVLFEAVRQDSGLYRGGFWGLNGKNRGEEVYAYEITFIDDHEKTAVDLEKLYDGQWQNLPRQTGHGGYNNYDPTTYKNVLTVSASGTALALISLKFISGPIGAAVAILGAGIALYSARSDGVTDTYPILRLPTPGGNAPISVHAWAPKGIHH